MNKIWMWLCQKIADYYFYSGIRIGWNTLKGTRRLNKYHDWIEYKFMFTEDK